MDRLAAARQLFREGHRDRGLAALREALDAAAPSEVEAAGRLIRKNTDASQASIRVAVLGQCTTQWVTTCLHASALRADRALIATVDGEFDNVVQELLSDHLAAWKPTVVVLVPWNQRLLSPDGPSAAERADAEVGFWQQVWPLCAQRLGARIVQVGYDWVHPGALGYHLGGRPDGPLGLVRSVNERLRASLPAGAYFVDLPAVSGDLGRRHFYDPRQWYWTRQPFSGQGVAALADHVWAGVRAVHTGPRKLLALDLDNTLWGGVVGEVGAHGVGLGESPEGQAHRAVQEHARALRDRGVVLAVVSKNNAADAAEPFMKNADMALKLEDIAAFEASWDPKAIALGRVATRLALGADSFVFLDDSPVEREHVRQELPVVTVAPFPEEPAEIVRSLVAGLWFESSGLTAEDEARGRQYAAEGQRTALSATFTSTGEYLASLDMRGDVRFIGDEDMQRVVQLLGKTNQFNLTTRRHGDADVRRMLADPRHVGLTLRLTDRFGDYGLIGVILAVTDERDEVLRVDTFAMSCRAIGRTVEEFFWNEFLDRCLDRGAGRIVADYHPTAKNALVRDLYPRLGLAELPAEHDGRRFAVDLREAVTRPATAVLRRQGPST